LFDKNEIEREKTRRILRKGLNFEKLAFSVRKNKKKKYESLDKLSFPLYNINLQGFARILGKDP